jgi:hypothetical protein
MAKITKAQMAKMEETKEELRALLKPGDEILTHVNHVSRSGMSRSISMKIIRDNQILDISYDAALVMGDKIDQRHDGIKISGCGMDMGFAIVYNLGRTLYPEGFKLADNQYGRNGDKSGYDNDGGYALKQRWL